MADTAGHTATTEPLLETKLYSPRWHPGRVPRPRLIERLEQGAGRKLTLVSAPAGFGKTTLLAEWLATLATREQPTTWVSLDRSDNDPALFWAYVITALQKLQPEVGASALTLLFAPQPSSLESIVRTLINEINAMDDGFTLFLDDYHVIEAAPIHDAIAFLLDHMPPQMRLVIASRSVPPLPLARLRARGESAELQATDLRFTPDEAAAFLNEVMELDLSTDDVTALETRTEGWIAGLQLAALSMQGRADVAGFIQAFAGDDRYIIDYLIEEVLLRQPGTVRTFLSETSVLERLSGSLCNAVTGREDGRAMLEALERGNLFVIPLDDKRRWYRYHLLFADVLQTRLLDEQPERVPALHQRASAWYEQHGQPAEAIHHALAALDFERAAALSELAWAGMHRTYQDARWLSWVKALPDELIRASPILSVGYAWALLNAGELETGERRLRDAERWLEPMARRPRAAGPGAPAESPAAGMVVEDDMEFRNLPATIAAARAFHAGALGDVEGAVKHARQAVDLSVESDHYVRGRAVAMLGLAYWSNGELEAAHRTFAEGMADIRMTGENQHLMTLSATAILAEIRVAQGRLHEAARIYEQALQLAAAHRDSGLVATAFLDGGMSDIQREWGDLEGATQRLLQSAEMGAKALSSEPQWSPYWLVYRARLRQSYGDLDGALDLLDQAERQYQRTPVPYVRPIPALKARVWIRQGRLADALAWVRGRGLAVDDDLTYMREFEHITLARLLIARAGTERDERCMRQALELLDRLQEAADAGERIGSLIESLMLQALAHQARGSIPTALAPLEGALTLAEPEGYVQVFVDEGEPMRDLLRHAAAAGIAAAHTRRLLSAFDGPAQPALAATAELTEPLTPREVEILRLIAAGLKNQEIADQLYVSLATVKRHIANTYGKLGVSYRTEAVARARELKLV